MNSIVSTAEADLTALDAKLNNLATQVAQEKIRIVTALHAHIQAHKAIVDKHQAEIDVARQMISKTAPAPSQEVSQGASPPFLLSRTSAKTYLDKTWRYWALGVMVIMIIAGKIYLP
jgi:hypothetical protein